MKGAEFMNFNLDYIEFWATRHCNLNCKSCSSCSPLMSEWFLDLSALERDLMRIKSLSINIMNISVLGGEPLLHHDIAKIFYIVKEIYPTTNLSLLTNGILLPSMNENFWISCRENDVMIKVTCFPIMSAVKRVELEKILQQNDVRYHMTDKKLFNKILVLNNKAAFDDIVKNCGCNKAYNLFDGHVSRCTVPMVTRDLNSYFDVDFITAGRLDIYSVDDGKQIIDFLETPNESCKNCADYTEKVAWERVGAYPKLKDWLVDD